MIRDQRERDEYIGALKIRYWTGEISEDSFTAGLHGAGGMCIEDIRHVLGTYAPPAPRQTFEERRMEVSRQWLKSYHT